MDMADASTTDPSTLDGLQAQLTVAERRVHQGGDLVRTLEHQDDDGASTVSVMFEAAAVESTPVPLASNTPPAPLAVDAATAAATATAATTATATAALTHGDRVALLKQIAKQAQEVAQFTGTGGMAMGIEDVRSPAVKTLLLVCQERLGGLRVVRDAQLEEIAARKAGTQRTLSQLMAGRQQAAQVALGTIARTWVHAVGPLLHKSPECGAHDVWRALVQDVSRQAAQFPAALAHPSDFVADVRVALAEARRQAEAAAGEASSSQDLLSALEQADDLDTVCAKYLHTVTSWHAVYTQTEAALADATADACVHTCHEEFVRRSTRVLGACHDAIQAMLQTTPQGGATIVARGGPGVVLSMSADIQAQHARAAFEALRARAAFELAEMEMCVHGRETPWHSTLPSSDTQLFPPLTSLPFGNGRSTSGT